MTNSNSRNDEFQSSSQNRREIEILEREMTEIEDVDEDVLSQIAAVEADAICNKRLKITPNASGTVHSRVKTEDENVVDGAYTAALKGSKSFVWQQQKTTHSTPFDAHRNRGSSQSRANAVATEKVFGNNKPDGGGDGIGGNDACFKCGKSGHWSRDCDVAIGGSDPSVPEKICPCGSGACSVRISNTEKNPGRKFYRCPVREENGGCGFFEWCDRSSSNPVAPGPAVNAAYKVNDTTDKSYGVANTPSSGSCFKCGQPGHWASNCSMANSSSGGDSGGRSGSTGGCFKCGQSGHWASNCTMTNSSSGGSVGDLGGRSGSTGGCYKCGQSGHWASNCTAAKSDSSGGLGGRSGSKDGCFKCGKSGHWGRDCPGQNNKGWR